MSINVILRPQDATSGGQIREISGEGTIDNRDEATAALGLLGTGTDVVIIGSDRFDRTRLERLRDGVSSAQATTSSPAASPAAAGLRIGSIQSSEDFPRGSRLYLFVDGNPSQLMDGGTPRDSIEIPADRRIDVRIPSTIADGNHTVQYRISRPHLPEARYMWSLRVHAAMATLTNASIVPPNTGTSFGTDPIKVRFTTSLAAEHRVRVNVGGHAETITVPAGAAGRQFDAVLSGQPKTWTDTGGTPDRRTRRYTVAVTVTPLGQGDRVGAPVNAGNVAIVQVRPRRASSGGTSHTQHAPSGLPGAGGR